MEELKKRDSFILLCKYIEDEITFNFVCNRNSQDFTQLYNDKYIRWFEYENIPSIMEIDTSSVEILETLYNIDNYNHRHQKDILNPCKKKWLDRINESKDDDEVITNKVIKNCQKSIRQLIHQRFDMICENIHSLSNDSIYEIIKQIWFNERLMKELDKPRYKFMSNKKEMTDIGVVAIVFKDYLLDRKKTGKKLPFEKGTNINKTIYNVIRLKI